jgi:hypothetical protein
MNADAIRLVKLGRADGMSDGQLLNAGIRRSFIEKPKAAPLVDKVHASIDDIARAFVDEAQRHHIGITILDFTDPNDEPGTRRLDLARPRQVAMHLVRVILGPSASFPAIGKYFGGRDHSTVMHAFKVSGPKTLEDFTILAQVASAVRAKFRET